jgi:phage-related protein
VNGWTVEPLNRAVEKELMDLPADMRAAFVRISELLIEHGPQHGGKPYVSPLRKKLYEMRMSGKDGIGRAIYIAVRGRRLIVLHAFIKKTQRTPKRAIDMALRRTREIR